MNKEDKNFLMNVMDSLVSVVGDLIRLLANAYKIYMKNGKLMRFLVFLIISFCSLIYLSNFFSIRPLIFDLVLKGTLLLTTSPNAPEFASLVVGMSSAIKFFFGVEWIVIVVMSIASLFFNISTIYASAMIHGGEEISALNLLSTTVRSWKRPLATFFYITLFNLGYNFFCLVALLPLLLPGLSSLGILVFVLAGAFYSYLAVVWKLSLVISVLEEEHYGIEALGKAAQLVKGGQSLGFVLNLLLTVLYSVIFQALRLIPLSRSTMIQVLVGLLVVNVSLLMRMLESTAYTVFYLDSKKRHGEMVDLPGSDMEYTKVPSVPPMLQSIP